ncbi:MAG: hypothetical protein AB7Q97_11945 [Gammaproteobacteria bacterium]
MIEATPRDAVRLSECLRHAPFLGWPGVEVIAVDHAAGTVVLRTYWRE